VDLRLHEKIQDRLIVNAYPVFLFWNGIQGQD